MVSAKPQGGTITTTVLTDEAGRYYFSPLAAGKYRVWAKALAFETASGEIDLAAVKKHDFTLRPKEDFVRQLPGDVMLASLPSDTVDDKRMQRLVRNNCTGCHTPSYVLQHRFDQDGWAKIIGLMKHVNVGGIYQRGPTTKRKGCSTIISKSSPLIWRAPVARLRAGLNLTIYAPKLSDEAARVVFTEYEVPLDPNAGLPADFVANNGSDWSLGTPSVLVPGYGVHDAWLDLNDNIWFTCNSPNRTPDHRQDRLGQAGTVTPFKIDARQRACRRRARYDARSEWHHLVQRQSRPRRPRPA